MTLLVYEVKYQRRCSLSLIELLVVITIIAILAGTVFVICSDGGNFYHYNVFEYCHTGYNDTYTWSSPHHGRQILLFLDGHVAWRAGVIPNNHPLVTWADD